MESNFKGLRKSLSATKLLIAVVSLGILTHFFNFLSTILIWKIRACMQQRLQHYISVLWQQICTWICVSFRCSHAESEKNTSANKYKRTTTNICTNISTHLHIYIHRQIHMIHLSACLFKTKAKSNISANTNSCAQTHTHTHAHIHAHSCKCANSENTKRDSVKLAAQLHKRNLLSKNDSNRVNKISFG